MPGTSRWSRRKAARLNPRGAKRGDAEASVNTVSLSNQVRERRWNTLRITALVLCSLFVWQSTGQAGQAAEQGKPSAPTVLAAVDQRAAMSLDGDWHAIVDPYSTGLQDFHGKPRADGFEQNRVAKD